MKTYTETTTKHLNFQSLDQNEVNLMIAKLSSQGYKVIRSVPFYNDGYTRITMTEETRKKDWFASCQYR
jgi:hypothetical protein